MMPEDVDLCFPRSGSLKISNCMVMQPWRFIAALRERRRCAPERLRCADLHDAGDLGS